MKSDLDVTLIVRKYRSSRIKHMSLVFMGSVVQMSGFLPDVYLVNKHKPEFIHYEKSIVLTAEKA